MRKVIAFAHKNGKGCNICISKKGDSELQFHVLVLSTLVLLSQLNIQTVLNSLFCTSYPLEVLGMFRVIQCLAITSPRLGTGKHDILG